MLTKSQKNGQNHKKTGKKRAIFPKRPFKRACPFKNGRLLYTAIIYGELLNIFLAESNYLRLLLISCRVLKERFCNVHSDNQSTQRHNIVQYPSYFGQFITKGFIFSADIEKKRHILYLFGKKKKKVNGIRNVNKVILKRNLK